jgi:sugar phosphate isomerase/epimerase
MRLVHREHPGRAVRLGYCLNLAAARSVEDVLEGARSLVAPLRARLCAADEPLGVGLWLPLAAALDLASDAGRERRERFADELAALGLEAFTFNAFPAGPFHGQPVKERVFRPTWQSPERLAFTLAVAQCALALRAAAERAFGPRRARAHVSISTHAGMHGRDVRQPEDLELCADNMVLAALHLAELEERHGVRIVLALEPEPRSSTNDTYGLEELHARLERAAERVLARGLARVRPIASALLRTHLGTCLDACHAAVEFEAPEEAFLRATAHGPLGKLQYSNALALAAPDENRAARARLLALDEPVYLHQVTGRRDEGLVRAGDLTELARAWESGEARWRGCHEWRCHFHVPVDLGGLAGASGLGTTRESATRVLAATLAAPDRWGTDELHVEIETYTWSVLPAEARGAGALVDGLERELAHVLAELAAHGWMSPSARGAAR